MAGRNTWQELIASETLRLMLHRFSKAFSWFGKPRTRVNRQLTKSSVEGDQASPRSHQRLWELVRSISFLFVQECGVVLKMQYLPKLTGSVCLFWFRFHLVGVGFFSGSSQSYV